MIAVAAAGSLIALANRDDSTGIKTTTHTVATPAPTPAARHTRPPEQSYSASAFHARYPAGWIIANDEEPQGDFLYTRFESVDHNMFIVVDRVPGEETDPQSKALQVESAVAASTSRYRRISLGSTTLGGKPAVKWVFEQPESGRTERRVDYFFQMAGDGYAVLGGGTDYPQVAPLTRRVAASVEQGPA